MRASSNRFIAHVPEGYKDNVRAYKREEKNQRTRYFIIGLITLFLAVGAFLRFVLSSWAHVASRDADAGKDIRLLDSGPATRNGSAAAAAAVHGSCWMRSKTSQPWTTNLLMLKCNEGGGVAVGLNQSLKSALFSTSSSSSSSRNQTTTIRADSSSSSGIRRSPRYFYDHKFTNKQCGACQGRPAIDAGTCIREATNPGFRCLPSFIITGVMKSGTGELMRWLNQHPNLQSGRGEDGTNEIHYFGDGYRRADCPWSAYLKRFPDYGGAGIDDTGKKNINTRNNRAREKYTFDKSPDYIRSKDKMLQISKMLPSVKILLLLRDPVTRAVSGFDHNCRHGRYVRLVHDLTVQVDPGTLYHTSAPQLGVNGDPLHQHTSIAAASSHDDQHHVNNTATNSDTTSSRHNPDSSANLPPSLSNHSNTSTSSSSSTGSSAVDAEAQQQGTSPTTATAATAATAAPTAAAGVEYVIPAGTVLTRSQFVHLVGTHRWRAHRHALEKLFRVLVYPCDAQDLHDYYFGPFDNPAATVMYPGHGSSFSALLHSRHSSTQGMSSSSSSQLLQSNMTSRQYYLRRPLNTTRTSTATTATFTVVTSMNNHNSTATASTTATAASTDAMSKGATTGKMIRGAVTGTKSSSSWSIDEGTDLALDLITAAGNKNNNGNKKNATKKGSTTTASSSSSNSSSSSKNTYTTTPSSNTYTTPSIKEGDSSITKDSLKKTIEVNTSSSNTVKSNAITNIARGPNPAATATAAIAAAATAVDITKQPKNQKQPPAKTTGGESFITSTSSTTSSTAATTAGGGGEYKKVGVVVTKRSLRHRADVDEHEREEEPPAESHLATEAEEEGGRSNSNSGKGEGNQQQQQQLRSLLASAANNGDNNQHNHNRNNHNQPHQRPHQHHQRGPAAAAVDVSITHHHLDHADHIDTVAVGDHGSLRNIPSSPLSSSTSTTASNINSPSSPTPPSSSSSLGHIRHIVKEQSLVSPFAADEGSIGYYDEQLQWTLELFSKGQILVLFQEDMKSNTLRTLQEVLRFLAVPCYDFSAIAEFPSPSQPPEIVPNTLLGQVHYHISKLWTSIQRYTGLSVLFGDAGSISSSQQLQRDLRTDTRTRLEALYAQRKQGTRDILDKEFSVSIPSSWNMGEGEEGGGGGHKS